MRVLDEQGQRVTRPKSPSTEPQNLVEYLLARAANPDVPAVSQKVNGAWVDVTWGQALAEVKSLSAALVAAGIQFGDRVACFGGTTLQWMLCDLAISAAGAITVPIYASNTPGECKYILNNAEASFLFVDHDVSDGRQPGRLSRIRAVLDECPSVRRVVVFEGAVSGDREQTLAALRADGERAHAASPDAFLERVGRVKADDLSTFIYTSGTTGDPKGVMQTHGGWAYQAHSMEKLRLMLPDDQVMLFLPFAHVFGQLIKSSWVSIGFKLQFAESPEKLLQSMAEVGPSMIPTVPRVIEKIYGAVMAQGLAAPGVKGRLFKWALRLFDKYVEARKKGRTFDTPAFRLARKLVFDKAGDAIRAKLGGKLRRFATGGAPLSAKIGWMMELLGFVVVEGYGLTESTAVAALNPPEPVGRAKIGTVGPALPGTEIILAEDGEVLIKGPSVMKGYFRKPEATAEALSAEGWLKSGDIGEIDSEGFVRITDRKKDILITAGGKNVAPQPLENQLKAAPLISQAMVHGDKRAYLTALISVNEETARKVLSDKGVTVGSYAELSRRPEILEAIQKVLDGINAMQPPYSTLKKFALLDHDFAQENGELTPTAKVKRKFITQKYQALLDGMYQERLVE